MRFLGLGRPFSCLDDPKLSVEIFALTLCRKAGGMESLAVNPELWNRTFKVVV
jgi:hypothetical protein